MTGAVGAEAGIVHTARVGNAVAGCACLAKFKAMPREPDGILMGSRLLPSTNRQCRRGLPGPDYSWDGVTDVTFQANGLN